MVADLDREPLALQIQAWLLESRLAEDRGKHERARLVLDRALQVGHAPSRCDWPLMRELALAPCAASTGTRACCARIATSSRPVSSRTAAPTAADASA